LISAEKEKEKGQWLYLFIFVNGLIYHKQFTKHLRNL
jgi:hypothetical protein